MDLIRANLARIFMERQNGIEPFRRSVSLPCRAAAVPRTLPHVVLIPVATEGQVTKRELTLYSFGSIINVKKEMTCP